MGSYGLGVLHAAAKYSNDLKLLQTITRLVPNNMSTKYMKMSPLVLLEKERFLELDNWQEMMECLLALDNSPEVMHNLVTACF